MSPSTAVHIIAIAYGRDSAQFDKAVRLLAYGRSAQVITMAVATAPLFVLAG